MSVLAADRSDLADSKAKIMVLQRHIRLLRQRLDAHKYNVLSLPNEIISEIFIHFLPVYPLCPPLFGVFSPYALTQICRKWKEIALSTPSLWRALSIWNIGNDAVECQVEMVESWLRKSGSLPLSIQMREPVDGVWPELLAPLQGSWVCSENS
ncbi:hypothetical protein B0H14DRAFT_2528285 [Mycena olivaceomarginata]|nr:hypothetical protein B0H14DRAFT_2528285 [Mycena olivaceomarginata]